MYGRFQAKTGTKWFFKNVIELAYPGGSQSGSKLVELRVAEYIYLGVGNLLFLNTKQFVQLHQRS